MKGVKVKIDPEVLIKRVIIQTMQSHIELINTFNRLKKHRGETVVPNEAKKTL